MIDMMLHSILSFFYGVAWIFQSVNSCFSAQIFKQGRRGVSSDHLEGYSGDYGTCMNKSHMEQGAVLRRVITEIE